MSIVLVMNTSLTVCVERELLPASCIEYAPHIKSLWSSVALHKGRRVVSNDKVRKQVEIIAASQAKVGDGGQEAVFKV